MRRFTRLTNAFSKKVENHAAAIALHSMYYNSSASIRRSRSHPLWLLAFRPSLGKLQALASFRKCPILLEQWELANFKPQYNFVVRQYAIGKGHSVSVMWRGGEVDTIFGFEKEADALEWIRTKSQAWLLEAKD